jgi:signal transduction histidine kinase
VTANAIVAAASRLVIRGEERRQLRPSEPAPAPAPRQAGQATEEFFCALAHEMRTPLSSIRGYSELLMDQDAEDADVWRRFVKVIDRNSRRLERLIGDLELVAKAESGTFEVDRSAVLLNEVLLESVEAAKLDAKSRRVALELRQAGTVTLLGDHSRLEQLFDNLISNAIKYTPTGGRVNVTLDQAGDRAWVEVIDTGGGISPADQRQLFARFFRIGGDDAFHKGFGLGLPIAKAIVEAHDGSIKVDSQRGIGTSIRVDFPIRMPSRFGGRATAVANALQPR